MSLEGGFEEVDESFRATANCFSNSEILANASASSRSSSVTRRARRSQFGQVFRRVPITRQHKPRGQNPPRATRKPVNAYKKAYMQTEAECADMKDAEKYRLAQASTLMDLAEKYQSELI